MTADPTAEWLHDVPKIELHVHLEGAIPLDALWALVQKYGGDASCPDAAALNARFRYVDFPHFLELWQWKNGFLREYEDFTYIAEAVARSFERQNILYVEAFYSPRDFARHGLQVQRITEAVRAGIDRVPSVDIQLVADVTRDFGPEEAAVTLEKVKEVRSLGVIGVGIGGSEQDYPPEPFAGVFEAAREAGLRTSAHAGEAAGPESVWGAINALRVDRIGHATRAIEDRSLVDYLRESQIPLELNPVSNVCTGVVDSIAAHPARKYLEGGLMVCINTDDPAMFQTTLVNEYRQLQLEAKLTGMQIERLLLNSVRASWMPDSLKQQWIERYRNNTHPLER